MCDKCSHKSGYYGENCKACTSHAIGSTGIICSNIGQCSCKEGWSGKMCDKCSHKSGYYGENCKACMCHALGSTGSTCSNIGQCSCKEGWSGKKCDKCASRYSGEKCDKCASRYSGEKCDKCASGYSGENCKVKCPHKKSSNWILLNGKCYYFSEDTKSFSQAGIVCRNKGGKIAEP